MIAIIQARNSSKRLPNKCMFFYKKKYVLERVINCIKKSKKIKKIIVATSKRKEDNSIERFCKKKNIKVYRGSLNNVLSRFYDILKTNKCNYFLRVCADSPFLDFKLIDKLYSKIKKNRADIFTNIFPKTFPSGQSVEIIKTNTFLKTYRRIKSLSDKEHVTRFFYKNSKNFRILNYSDQKDYSNFSLSLDHKIDLIKYKKIINFTKDRYFEWKKILQLI